MPTRTVSKPADTEIEHFVDCYSYYGQIKRCDNHVWLAKLDNETMSVILGGSNNDSLSTSQKMDISKFIVKEIVKFFMLVHRKISIV